MIGFGEYAIKIGLKMMARSGEQHAIGKACIMLKKAFEENGVPFAFPTVTVAGGETTGMAARKRLELVQAAVRTT
jgi:hypothetical protein